MKFNLIVTILAGFAAAKLKDGDCEVCIRVVNDLEKAVKDAGVSTPDKIETVIEKYCAKAKLKENRFCYYIGATEDAATKLVKEVSKPLSFSVPAEKICEKLKAKDGQICELKYEKELDWANINLKKMKIKELKKILSGWGDSCKGCVEKGDFVNRIETLKPQFVKEEL